MMSNYSEVKDWKRTTKFFGNNKYDQSSIKGKRFNSIDIHDKGSESVCSKDIKSNNFEK